MAKLFRWMRLFQTIIPINIYTKNEIVNHQKETYVQLSDNI